MDYIFVLYNDNKLVSNFKTLLDALKYIKESLTCNNYEIYVEEYNNELETHMIKTLIYKNEQFNVNNVFNYY